MQVARNHLHDFLAQLHEASSETDVVRRTHRHMRDFRAYLSKYGFDLAGLAGAAFGPNGVRASGWLGKGTVPRGVQRCWNDLPPEDDFMLVLDSGDFRDARLEPSLMQGAPSIGAVFGRAHSGPGPDQEQAVGLIYITLGSLGRQTIDALVEVEVAARAFIDRMACRLIAFLERFKYDLTGREREVLCALASGGQRAHIAHSFGIAVPTVDLHLANLRRKLGANTLAEAIFKAQRYGLL